MTDVSFASNPWRVRAIADRLRDALRMSDGDQVAMTEIASMVSASIQFLANHYGIEQARSAWDEATLAAFTQLENQDYDRQQEDCVRALEGR